MFLEVSDLCRNSNRTKTAVSSRVLSGEFNEQAGGTCNYLTVGLRVNSPQSSPPLALRPGLPHGTGVWVCLHVS